MLMMLCWWCYLN